MKKKNNDSRVIGGIGEKKSNNNTQWYQQDRIYDCDIAIAVTTAFNPYYAENKWGGNNLMQENKLDDAYKEYANGGDIGELLEKGIEYQEEQIKKLRIRKLTPKECFRLQGIKDEDADKMTKHQSQASAYHLAGDSIICYGVLTAIFGELFGVEWQKMMEDKEWFKK